MICECVEEKWIDIYILGFFYERNLVFLFLYCLEDEE